MFHTYELPQPMYKYLDDIRKKIDSAYSVWQPDGTNRKTVHTIRLELKKLLAFSGFCDQGALTDYNRHIKPAFKILGKLRKAAIRERILKEAGQDKKIIRAAKNTKRKWISKTRKKMPRAIRQIRTGVEKLSKYRPGAYGFGMIAEKTGLLAVFGAEHISRSNAHRIRKEIKFLILVSPFLQPALRLKDTQPLKTLDRELGRWHDLFETRKYLKKKELTDTAVYKKVVGLEKKALAILRKNARGLARTPATSYVVHQ